MRGLIVVPLVAGSIGVVVFIMLARSARARAFAVFFTLAAIVTGIAISIHMLRPMTDLKAAVIQANQLIAAAGGPAKVCAEAKQIFSRFGGSEDSERWLTAAELRDYPAIAALAKASEFGAVVEPGGGSFPPCIQVKVGTRLNGYCIVIVDTNSPITYPHSTHATELVDSCIFVSG